MTTTGGCMCGDIKYEYTGEPAVTALCHCTDCQKWTGAAYTSNAVVPRQNFKVTSGSPKTWDVKGDSGKVNKHFFCGQCGSSLYTELEVMPDVTCVKAGGLDGGAASLGGNIGVEFYTKDRVSGVTDKSKEMDNKYQVSNKAWNAWGGLNTYFEKAMGTPTGQKLRSFYQEGEKQVTDVHNEARRLADLKKGQQEPNPVAGAPGKTACSCGGSEGVCGCAPGKCSCVNCAKSDNPSKTENPPQEVKGTNKTVCTCGGKDGVCGCAPGQCACASCGKSTQEAVVEVKEAAQASGQTLPKETFGTA